MKGGEIEAVRARISSSEPGKTVNEENFPGIFWYIPYSVEG